MNKRGSTRLPLFRRENSAEDRGRFANGTAPGWLGSRALCCRPRPHRRDPQVRWSKDYRGVDVEELSERGVEDELLLEELLSLSMLELLLSMDELLSLEPLLIFANSVFER